MLWCWNVVLLYCWRDIVFVVILGTYMAIIDIGNIQTYIHTYRHPNIFPISRDPIGSNKIWPQVFNHHRVLAWCYMKSPKNMLVLTMVVLGVVATSLGCGGWGVGGCGFDLYPPNPSSAYDIMVVVVDEVVVVRTIFSQCKNGHLEAKQDDGKRWPMKERSKVGDLICYLLKSLWCTYHNNSNLNYHILNLKTTTLEKDISMCGSEINI